MARVHRFAPSILLLVAVSVVHADAVEPLRDKSSGRMFALRVAPGSTPASAQGKAPAVAELRATADAFIAANRELIGLADPSRDLIATPVSTDKLGLSRVRYLQTYRGLDVLGGEVQVHMDLDGRVTYVKTKVARELPGETVPSVAQSQAEDAALEAAVSQGMDLGSLQVWRSRLLLLPLGMVRNEAAEQTHLAWEVVVVDAATTGGRFSQGYYFDVLNGDLLLELALSQSIHRLLVDFAAETGNRIQMNGYDVAAACLKVVPDGCGAEGIDVQSPLFAPYVFGRSEGKPARGPYPNPNPSPYAEYYGTSEVDSLYDRLGEIHDYFYAQYGLNGANNLGGAARVGADNGADPSLTQGGVHIDSGALGNVCPNAFYTYPSGAIVLCQGMATNEIVGHEYFHAVQRGAILEDYNNIFEMGALQEGSSDYMGEMFELLRTGSCDWESIFRSLADPESRTDPHRGVVYPRRFGSPDVVCVPVNDDNGGVHHNSTVVSHGLYLASEGGTENGCIIQGQGKTATERILVRAWLSYFSATESFNEAYADLIQASSDLYSPAVTAEVTKALQAVEMDQPGLCSGLPASNPPCSVVGVGDSPRSEATIRLLSQLPARGAVRFAYRVATAGRVEVRVHDLAGRLVARPVADDLAAGEHVAEWDGRIDGASAAAGAYFLSVTLDGESLGARKLVLMR